MWTIPKGVNPKPLPSNCELCDREKAHPMGTLCLKCSKSACVSVSGSFYTTTHGRWAVARPKAVGNEQCAACYGCGWISVMKDGYQYVEPCPAADTNSRLDLFDRAKVPAKYHNAAFSTMKLAQPALKAVTKSLKMWVNGFQPGEKGKLLSGSPGVGKTHLLCSMIKTMTIARGIEAAYIDWGELVSKIKRGYIEKSNDDVVANLADVQVLVIDELGREKVDGWKAEELARLLERRYHNPKLTTLAATNASEIELERNITERLISRCFEMMETTRVIARDFRRFPPKD